MCIILVTGPSGSGKDSLLRHARAHFPPERLAFARRYITRPPDKNEDNYFVDEDAFLCLEANALFVSTWQAHGNRYGIGWREYRQAQAWQNRAETEAALLCSVSRTVIADFERQFTRVITLNIFVPPEILAERLEKRGRETKTQAAGRLARADLPLTASNLIVFDNSAPLAESAARFIAVLDSILNKAPAVSP